MVDLRRYAARIAGLSDNDVMLLNLPALRVLMPVTSGMMPSALAQGSGYPDTLHKYKLKAVDYPGKVDRGDYPSADRREPCLELEM